MTDKPFHPDKGRRPWHGTGSRGPDRAGGRPPWAKPPALRSGPRPETDAQGNPLPAGFVAPVTDGMTVLYGWHPVTEALRNPARRHRELLATENGARRLTEELGTLPLEPRLVRPRDLDRLLTPDAVHQGLYLVSEPLPSPPLASLGPDALVLALDQITDPHNVGAMLRSAAAFKVDAVLVTIRHAPEATGVLAKSASGALEHVPMIAVRNLGDALEELGKLGFTRLGFDSDAPQSLDELTLTRPLVIVMGAEGKGLRARTRELLDHFVRLDMPGAIRSLNVSNATAIALYAATRPAR